MVSHPLISRQSAYDESCIQSEIVDTYWSCVIEADCDHHADGRKNGGRPCQCDVDNAQYSFVYFFESRSRMPK